MDRRERVESLEEMLLAAFQGFQSGIWTALPAIVVGYDAAAQTITAKSTIKARVLSRFEGPTGAPPIPGAVYDSDNWWWVTLPPLLDVPVVFPSGGGFTLTFPIAVGDEVLIVFSSRCIDAWWQSAGVQVQAQLRMHDLSDGFAIPGPKSQPRRLSGVSTTTVQLRDDDGDTYIEIAGGGIVNIVATETHFTGQVWANGHRIDETHRHPGVNIGIGTTGAVVP